MENNEIIEKPTADFKEQEDTKENKNYHYIGVMFESKYGDVPYSGKVYEYKTLKDLKKGQVIKIKTNYGESNVCIVKENIPKNELQFIEVNKIKEI